MNLGGTRFSANKLTVSGVGFGLLGLIISTRWLLYLITKNPNLKKLREKFFRQNDGLLLLTQQSCSNLARMKMIFTALQLQQATNHYANDRILGRCMYGTVFKGILNHDPPQPIAIKPLWRLDQTRIHQFINQVIVHAQINHPNVVKLLGCCLETEAPLLVYEYISNGTLFDHIHGRADHMPLFSWDDRLRVAIEVTGALSYLHSSATMPVSHRDVINSRNILLDEGYNAKVSDLVAWRVFLVDETEVELAPIAVRGMVDYLDPEIVRTGQLTEKSDVYSFGVVLVELMTGRKPAFFNGGSYDLGTFFTEAVEGNRLWEILDGLVVRQLEQVEQVAALAVRCLTVNGEDRPTMREVMLELESSRRGSNWID